MSAEQFEYSSVGLPVPNCELSLGGLFVGYNWLGTTQVDVHM